MRFNPTIILSSALLLYSTFSPEHLIAGTYTDELSKCFLTKATTAEKTTLAEWIFSTLALNPKVSKMSAISPAQRTKIYADTALLLENLVAKTCRSEVLLAIKNEGVSSLSVSFGKLGELAAEELFSSPKVIDGISEIGNLIDKKKLETIFAPAK